MTQLFESQQAGLKLRYYQREAINAAYSFLRKRDDNPCIVLPTGAGKTAVMATIACDVVERWGGRVLVLSHVKELIEQTAETLSAWYPGLSVGVYSAGLNRRESKADILVAGIQSVHKKGLKITGADPFKCVLIDEAHRIPTSGDGMYRNLLSDLLVANPKTRVVGLTATPYRLKGGWVCGPDHFLNEICYEAGIRELIAKGYLCPLTSKLPRNAVDSSEIMVRNGEFASDSLSAAFDDLEIVDMAVAEVVEKTAERKSVLVFCCDVQHAEHVANALAKKSTEPGGMITGETGSVERAKTIEMFKAGRLKYLLNVNVLTEGFDARQVDCVVLLRSTLSPGLFYQMVGRGLRTHVAKADCLVLDFGGNVQRHGCIDQIRVKSPKASGSGGEAPTRTCPQCQEIVAVQYIQCTACGYEFQQEHLGPNHEATADETPITSDQVEAIVHNVSEVTYSVHEKRDAEEGTPKTMRVSYYDGLQIACEEWVCVEHGGFAGNNASQWWHTRTDWPKPDSAAEAVRLATLGYLAEPMKIAYTKPPGERFKRISKYWLGPKPDPREIETVIDEWGEEVRVDSLQEGDDDIPF